MWKLDDTSMHSVFQALGEQIHIHIIAHVHTQAHILTQIHSDNPCIRIHSKAPTSVHLTIIKTYMGLHVSKLDDKPVHPVLLALGE